MNVHVSRVAALFALAGVLGAAHHAAPGSASVRPHTTTQTLAFLKISGVTGEVVDPTFGGYIALLTSSFGASGAPLQAGAATPLVFVKQVDSTSPIFAAHLASGNAFATGTLDVVTTNGSGYTKIAELRFTSLKVTANQTTITSGGTPLETLTMSLQSLVYCAYPLNGSPTCTQTLSAVPAPHHAGGAQR